MTPNGSRARLSASHSASKPSYQSLKDFTVLRNLINHLQAVPITSPLPVSYKEDVADQSNNATAASGASCVQKWDWLRSMKASLMLRPTCVYPQFAKRTQKPLHLQQIPPFSTTQRTQPNPSSGILTPQEGLPCAPSFFV